MTFDEYSKLAIATAKPEVVDDFFYAALSLAGEAGEYVDLFKKWEYHGRPTSPAEFAHELGDVLWSLNIAARQHGFTLEDIARLNIEKLRRRYPDGYVDGGGVR